MKTYNVTKEDILKFHSWGNKEDAKELEDRFPDAFDIKSKFGQRKQCERFSFSVKCQSSGFRYNSRQEATENAILTANKIYNENV